LEAALGEEASWVVLVSLWKEFEAN
jgi:hypothetical protein